MKNRIYSWETRFMTDDNLIVHTFSDRVKVITDTQKGITRVIKDDKVIITRQDIDIATYEKFLADISKDVNQITF